MKRTTPESHPVNNVIWVPLDEVVANDYNPNKVAKNEMRLLAVSILNDGFTQPIVTVRDKKKKKYVIVDGFHRYYSIKTNKEVYESTGGMAPVVVLDKDISQRMAATVRHNRARGKHGVTSMSVMVGSLREQGWDDMKICNELGLEAEELVRLQNTTGVSEIFKNREYSKSWESVKQIKARRAASEKL